MYFDRTGSYHFRVRCIQKQWCKCYYIYQLVHNIDIHMNQNVEVMVLLNKVYQVCDWSHHFVAPHQFIRIDETRHGALSSPVGLLWSSTQSDTSRAINVDFHPRVSSIKLYFYDFGHINHSNAWLYLKCSETLAVKGHVVDRSTSCCCQKLL